MSDVDVKMVVAVLVEAGGFGSGAHVAGHRVTDDCAGDWQVFTDDLGQGRVLTVRNVIEQREVGLTAKHTEDSVDLSGEHRAL